MSKLDQPLLKRFRDWGFNPGLLAVGKRNLISDVPGVLVGHFTKIEGDNCRTGITLVDPGLKNLNSQKLPAGGAVGNGHGKQTGFTQLEELGTLEAPIALTNTTSVGTVMQGIVDLVLKRESLERFATVNAIVGEVNDGRVSDIHKNFLRASDVDSAARQLTADFALGSVGGGTGTRAFSWKGGIGSSSRVIEADGQQYTVGALVQTNFGGSLTIMGVSIGQLLGKDDFDFVRSEGSDGSCMIIIATDAPLSARQLKRIASRGLLGMVRTGAIMAHTSGDYAVAFSTSRTGLETVTKKGLPDGWLNPFFLAAVESVEESIYDAMFVAETVTGRQGTLERLPLSRVVKLIKDRQ